MHHVLLLDSQSGESCSNLGTGLRANITTNSFQPSVTPSNCAPSTTWSTHNNSRQSITAMSPGLPRPTSGSSPFPSDNPPVLVTVMCGYGVPLLVCPTLVRLSSISRTAALRSAGQLSLPTGGIMITS